MKDITKDRQIVCVCVCVLRGVGGGGNAQSTMSVILVRKTTATRQTNRKQQVHMPFNVHRNHKAYRGRVNRNQTNVHLSNHKRCTWRQLQRHAVIRFAVGAVRR